MLQRIEKRFKSHDDEFNELCLIYKDLIWLVFYSVVVVVVVVLGFDYVCSEFSLVASFFSFFLFFLIATQANEELNFFASEEKFLRLRLQKGGRLSHVFLALFIKLILFFFK